MPPVRQPVRVVKPEQPAPVLARAPVRTPPPSSMAALQSRLGNTGLQQMLQQRQKERTAPPAARATQTAPASASVARQASEPARGGADNAGAPPAAPGTRAAAAAQAARGAATATTAAPGPGGAQAAPQAAQARGTAPAGASMLGTAAPGVAAPAAPGSAAEAPREAAPLRPSGGGQALTKLKGHVAAAAHKLSAHPHGSGAVSAAQAAAVAPGPAAQTAAADATVAGLAAAPTAKFDAGQFKAALRKKLAEVMPPPASAEQAQKALESGTAQSVGSAMKTELGQHRDAATGGLPAAAASAPNADKFPQPQPPAIVPPAPAPAVANPGGAGAVPEPLPKAALDTSADRSVSDSQLAGVNMTDAQLRKANEPAFAAAGDARAKAIEHATTTPAEVRQAEGGIRSDAQARAGVLVGKELTGMTGARTAGFGKVHGAQTATKEKDEAERKKIAGELDRIQHETRTDVEKLLQEMDDGATSKFEKGLAEALAAFDAEREALERKARMQRAQDWSIFGGLGAIVGYFWSLGKDEVDKAITSARAAYNRVVDRTIETVADFVGEKLTAAKTRIVQGRAAAEAYIKGLPEGVRAIGQEALTKVSAEFDTLAGDIDSRRDGLIDKLGEKYAEACREVDTRAQAFRDANKSLWDRARDAVAGVVQTLLQLKAMLLAIAIKAANVVDAILADPIQFLKNLATGVKQGLQAFVANIVQHLKAGLFQWLFGTLAAAGIQLPERFDAKGIFGLIASVLGLTYANIRARAVLKLGEPLVAKLEMVAEVFKVLITEGPMGLWHMLLEKLEALKEQVLGQIREMLMTQVIKAGVIWLIGLLNPASAFVKACKAIYDVVMFFVEKGQQIADFVNAVLDSLAAIAAGQLGGVAKMVEGALAKAVPVVIGFLAGLLGLGGLSEKIKGIVDKIQAPVNKAIDWVIDKAVGLVKKVGSALGLGKKEDNKPDSRTGEEKQRDLEAGLVAADALLADETADLVALRKRLAPIKAKYGFTSLDFEVVKERDGGGEKVHVQGEINPKGSKPGHFRNLRELIDALGPINGHLAGHTVEITSGPLKGVSVSYNALGFPDFAALPAPYCIKSVKIQMNGNRLYRVPDGDFGNANEKAGYDRNQGEPSNYTWHHHQDRTTMVLVKSDVHDTFRHSGGVWVIKHLGAK